MNAEEQNSIDKLGQAIILTFHSPEPSNLPKTYSVASRLTRWGVSGPFFTSGGFKVEVVIEEAYIKTHLRRKKQSNPDEF